MLTFAAYCGWTEEDAPGIDDAAQWLASGVSGDGLDCRPDKPDRHMYLFDLGMIAQGLLRYGVHTADARLVETGLAVVRTIRSALPPDVEVLRPVLGRHDLAPTWSTAGVAHLLKLLLSLLTAAELGDHASVAAADRLVASLGTPFQPGRTPPIVTCPGAEAISLHAACYAAEGLWAYGTARHHAGSSQQAHEIARWIWTRQLPDGGFPGFVDTGGRPMGGSQSDVLAQAVRLAYLTRADVAGIDRAVQALTASSARHGELAAMVYSPSSGKVHLNTWATTFAAQALDLHDSPDQLFDWRHLV